MTLGQKLRFYRTAEGYSQEAVAQVLHIERSSYSNYELDKTIPNIYALFALSRLFGITMEMLVDDRVEPVGAEEFLAKYKKGGISCSGRVIEHRLHRLYHRRNARRKPEEK
ncbi:MAG: helix-turn-helix transcriptional regulator [Hominenteromicrobium sp.]